MPCFARSVERVEQGIFCLWHFIYPFCKFIAFLLKLADNVFPYILYIFIVRTRMSAR